MDTHFNIILEEKLNKLFAEVIDALAKESIRKENAGSSEFALCILLATKKDKVKAKLQAELKETNYAMLFERWPKLQAMYDIILQDHRIMVEEFKTAFVKHKDEISQKLLSGKPIKKIQGLSFGDADCHNHGRMVFIVATDAGKFVYKPHSCSVDVALKDLTDKYCPGIVYIPKVVAAGNVAFCEFVDNQRAANLADTRAFYYNLGGLAAMANALGMNDLHCENILALNTVPVCIDTETTLTPKQKTNDDIAAYTEELARTVLATTMFSNLRVEEGKSASPFLARSSKTMLAPVIDDVAQCGADYSTDVLQGFSDVYELFLTNRQAIAKDVSQWRCEIRFVPRNTYVYAFILDKLHQPAALEEASVERSVLDRLGKADRQAKVSRQLDYLKAEEKSLLSGNIPRFYTFSHEYHLYLDGELVKENYFDFSSIENSLASLEKLSAADKHFQLSIIRQTLERSCVPLAEPVPTLDDCRTPISDDEVVAFVQQALDALTASVLETAKGKRVLLNSDKDKDAVNFMKFGFGNGYAGVGAMALAALKLKESIGLDASMTSRLRSLVEMAYAQLELIIVRLEKRSELVLADNNLGLEAGIGGIIYSLNLFAQQDDRTRATKFLNRLLRLIERLDLAVLDDNKTTLYDGLAGLLYALAACPLSSLTAQLIRKTAARLLAMQNLKQGDLKLWRTYNNRPTSGFGTGMAGIGYAFLTAYQRVAEPLYLEAAQEVLRYEAAAYDDKLQNWPDLRFNSYIKYTLNGQGSGAPGMLSFMGKAQEAGLELADVNLERCRKALLCYSNIEDYYCNGNAGLVEALLKLGEHEEAGALLGQMLRRYAELGYFVAHREQATSFYKPDLFYGISGIIYLCLRYLDSKNIQPIII